MWSLLASADTNVVNLAQNVNDTVQAVLPTALVIVGLLLSITVGLRVFRRISSGR